MATVSTSSTSSSQIARRLAALREQMALHQLDAYFVPSGDEHINEYLPENKQRRAWISGFTGSAGDFLLTTTAAWVFVDSRYYEQADYEVDADLIHVVKAGLPGQPTVTEQIKAIVPNQSEMRLTEARLGFDPFTLSLQQFQSFEKSLAGSGWELCPVVGNLVDLVWREAPPDVRSEVFTLPDAVSGEACSEKLRRVRERLKSLSVQVLPITKLDQVAWLFNLRGQDIPYNPVFKAYAIITVETAHLFVDASRLHPEVFQALGQAVQFHPYEAYAEVLQDLSRGNTVLIDPKCTTLGTLTLVRHAGGATQEAEHPVELLKAIKNAMELQGMQSANLKASRGKIRAWYWLTCQCAEGHAVSEEDFRQAIEGFYAEEPRFFGLSFNTIAGAGANGSIVHYGTPNPEKYLESGELFLIDSGCQFIDGTTDDTRTWLIGDMATPLQRFRYTEVLKAHINCAMQRFPKGTEGARLDGITRATLWQHGLDYGHGTGHGVGAFLNVHEGPNGIHRLASKPLEPGMINSIEPGFYEPGWGGIRLENLYRVVEVSPGDGQRTLPWYGFESLTYVPFDKKLIDISALSESQLSWLQAYHQAILDKIGPTLAEPEREWLQRCCEI